MSKLKKSGSMPRVFYCLICMLFLLNFFHLTADGFLQWPEAHISVYEPGQKAIIGWNGEREVMILSTDVYASEQAWVVELIPFPALPENPVTGSFDAFGVVGGIINREGVTWNSGDVNMDGTINIVDALIVAQYYVGLIMLPRRELGDVNQNGVTDIVDALMIAQRGAYLNVPGWDSSGCRVQVNILFEETAGVHNLTGLQVDDADALIAAADNLIRQKVPDLNITWQELRALAEDYISQGMSYWVLDLLELGDLKKSREPVVYVFDSASLYFPLKISSATRGDSVISLFTLTDHSPDTGEITGDWRHWIGQSNFAVTREELEMISPEVTELFAGDAILSFYQYDGPLGSLDYDFIAQ